MRTEFVGDILSVRAVEDCIRSTRKYTKGAFRKPATHPIQGEEFPSKVLTEYYEVYPDMEVGWDMLAADAWAWVLGDILHIDVFFHYNYATNKARVIIHGGNTVTRDLGKGVPGFSKALARTTASERNSNKNRHERAFVGKEGNLRA